MENKKLSLGDKVELLFSVGKNTIESHINGLEGIVDSSELISSKENNKGLYEAHALEFLGKSTDYLSKRVYEIPKINYGVEAVSGLIGDCLTLGGVCTDLELGVLTLTPIIYTPAPSLPVQITRRCTDDVNPGLNGTYFITSDGKAINKSGLKNNIGSGSSGGTGGKGILP